MQYKDEIITLNEDDGTFNCHDLDIYRFDTYKKVCEQIDRLHKADKEVISKVPVLSLNRSLTGTGHGTAGAKEKSRYASGFEYWVSWDVLTERHSKRREKVSASELILDTPENVLIIEKIIDTQKKINVLGDEQDALRERLTTLATHPAPAATDGAQ